MERTLLAWNFPNWITILLMAGAGYLLAAGITQAVRWRSAGPADSNPGGY